MPGQSGTSLLLGQLQAKDCSHRPIPMTAPNLEVCLGQRQQSQILDRPFLELLGACQVGWGWQAGQGLKFPQSPPHGEWSHMPAVCSLPLTTACSSTGPLLPGSTDMREPQAHTKAEVGEPRSSALVSKLRQPLLPSTNACLYHSARVLRVTWYTSSLLSVLGCVGL